MYATFSVYPFQVGFDCVFTDKKAVRHLIRVQSIVQKTADFDFTPGQADPLRQPVGTTEGID